MYDSTDFTYLPINCYQLLSDAYRIYHLRNFYTTDNLRSALEDNLIENSAKNSENHKLRISLSRRQVTHTLPTGCQQVTDCRPTLWPQT